MADVTGLSAALAGKSDIGHNHDNDYAAKTHNHDGVYQPVGDYAPTNHNHDTKIF